MEYAKLNAILDISLAIADRKWLKEYIYTLEIETLLKIATLYCIFNRPVNNVTACHFTQINRGLIL
jgi:hypothetical protein